MRLKTIRLENFRCFQEFSLNLDPNITVLVGKNGAGKTAILDAIAIGLGAFITRIPKVSGKNFDPNNDIRVTGDEKLAPYTRVAIENSDDLKWDRTRRRDSSPNTVSPSGLGVKDLNRYIDTQYIDSYNQGEDFQLPIFAYYGTGRGVFDIPRRRRDFLNNFSRFDTYKDTLDAKADFRQFFKYFYYLEQLEKDEKIDSENLDYALPELKAIRRAIEKAIPNISNPRIKQNPLRFLIDWKYDDSASTLRVEQLSDGYRITLAMIADIASRMVGANPHMQDPLLSEGIVLIDEIELHLHPQLQREIIQILQIVFPNIQYVCTTHSAPAISHIQMGSVFVLENVNNHVHANQVHTYGHDTNFLLEKVFDTDKNPAEIQKLIDLCAKAIDLDQFDKANEYMLDLIGKVGKDNPDVIYLNGLIKFMSD